MQNKHAFFYTLIVTANAMLVAFEALLVTGRVPLPVSVAWLTPCVVAGLTVLTTQLPKLVPEQAAPPTASVRELTPLVAPPPAVNANPAAPATVAYTPSPSHQAAVTLDTSAARLVTFPSNSGTAALPIPQPPEPPVPPHP